MKKLYETIIKKTDAIKSWMHKPKVKEYSTIAVFALVAFIWCYAMTGYSLIGLAGAVVGIAILTLKRALINEKKFLYKILFFSSLILIYAFYLWVGTAFTACFATGIWLIAYISFIKRESLKEWTAGAFTPFLIVLYAEFMQNNIEIALSAWFVWQDASRVGFVISVLLVTVVTTFFIKLFGGKRIGYCISLALFGILSITNLFVYAITGQPFTWSDIHNATAAAGVINTQSMATRHWIRFAFGLVLLACFFVIIIFIYKKNSKKVKITKRVLPVAGLSCILAIAVMASGWLYSIMLLYNGHLKYGFIGNFYITLNEKINIPDDADKYVIEDENDNGDYRPNVIIIMNEAFSDIGTTFDLSLTEDPLEYFHSLQKEYPSGISYTSVRGNNTCSSEWELLSGSPTALTAKGAMIYQNNCKPMRSIVSLFNSRGYTTVGLHPYYGFGYNRDNMYSNLGFDQSIFIEDMPETMDTTRGFITDKANYEYLISVYEQNKASNGGPFFCFNITMQNHGGYTTSQMDDIKIIGEKEYKDVNTYLSVLQKSDEALKTLISYFESVEEDTVILFFGDHQPMIDTTFYDDIYGKSFSELTVEELQNVYAVPYLIWANYDLNKEAAPEETSICYLSSILFEVGGLPKSTWINMIDEYRETFPVITTNFIKDGNGRINTKDTILNSPGKKSSLLKLYQKYSYGILYGLQ